jgi:ketopantoate reductase
MNKSLDPEKKVIFFAYNGPQSGIADNNIDSIKRAIQEYNKHQKGYIAKSWKEYRKTTAISKDVLDAIDRCDVLVADLTYFNHNVLFELGYAIAKGRNILIILNEQHQLDGLETAGKGIRTLLFGVLDTQLLQIIRIFMKHFKTSSTKVICLISFP